MIRNRMMIAAVGAAAMSAMYSPLGGLDVISAAPEPGNGRQRQAAPSYRPKLPVTQRDHERIRQAEAKRARKAERLRMAQAKGGIG